jgi:DNA-binding GntR family transcriptional regulator
MLAGLEVGPRVGMALHGAQMLSRGGHSGSVFGAHAAAAATGALLHLDAARFEDGNERVQEQARQLTLPLYRLRMHHLMDPAYARTSAAKHALIVDAILEGDGGAAERAMRNHIRNSGVAMLEALARKNGRAHTK